MTLHAWKYSVYHDVSRSGVTRCQQRRYPSLGHIFQTRRMHVKHESLKSPIKQTFRQTVPRGLITMFSTGIDSIWPINFQSLFGFLFIPTANHISLWDRPGTSNLPRRGKDCPDIFSIFFNFTALLLLFHSQLTRPGTLIRRVIKIQDGEEIMANIRKMMMSQTLFNSGAKGVLDSGHHSLFIPGWQFITSVFIQSTETQISFHFIRAGKRRLLSSAIFPSEIIPRDTSSSHAPPAWPTARPILRSVKLFLNFHASLEI